MMSYSEYAKILMTTLDNDNLTAKEYFNKMQPQIVEKDGITLYPPLSTHELKLLNLKKKIESATPERLKGILYAAQENNNIAQQEPTNDDFIDSLVSDIRCEFHYPISNYTDVAIISFHKDLVKSKLITVADNRYLTKELINEIVDKIGIDITQVLFSVHIKHCISNVISCFEIYDYCTEELAKLKDDFQIVEIPNQKKLKWLGNSAQFGFFIQELIGKGYLDKPTRSYSKDANLYLSIFEIDTKVATLAKEISSGENQNSLSVKNRNQIRIPHKDKIS